MYLNENEKVWAPTLWRALQAGKQMWEAEMGKHVGLIQGVNEKVTGAAENVVNAAAAEAEKDGVNARLDYIQLNWADTLELVGEFEAGAGGSGSRNEERAAILSGAMWVGKTRLIDNMILGPESVVKQIIS
jgi:pantoate--beta-alanine ligase